MFWQPLWHGFKTYIYVIWQSLLFRVTYIFICILQLSSWRLRTLLKSSTLATSSQVSFYCHFHYIHVDQVLRFKLMTFYQSLNRSILLYPCPDLHLWGQQWGLIHASWDSWHSGESIKKMSRNVYRNSCLKFGLYRNRFIGSNVIGSFYVPCLIIKECEHFICTISTSSHITTLLYCSFVLYNSIVILFLLNCCCNTCTYSEWLLKTKFYIFTFSLEW